jgi:dihydrofolate synthase/folylpolyglutamate synthase
VKPGLERIAGLLDLLAHPEQGYPVLHVAGTNGKTSTARMAAAIIAAHGLKPGLFTSPHLHTVEERFAIALEPMTRDVLASELDELAPLVDLYEQRSGDPITYFELTAALAFDWFADRAVDAAVVEVGLGGRLDATNVVNAAVAVVTSIGIEHTEYLGTTVEEIAAEKVAILDAGAVLVTGGLPPEAAAVAERRARELETPWLRLGSDVRIGEVRQALGGWLLDLEGAYGSYHDVGLALHGRYQVTNFAVAVAAVEALFGRALDPGAVAEAAAAVTSPGRMEILRRDPIVLVDGAHNPHGATALGEALGEEFPTTRWHLVLGAMSDKDLDEMLVPLQGRVAAVEAAAAGIDRARPADEVAALAGASLGVPAAAHRTVAGAVAAALRSGDPVLVTGSIYVVGEARAAVLEQG